MTDPTDSGTSSPDTRPIYGPPSYVPQYRHTQSYLHSVAPPLTALPIDIDLETESLLVRACYSYLSTKGGLLYAYWDISKPDHRMMAALWLAEQIEAVEVVLRRENP
jgi:hypothetical protein